MELIKEYLKWCKTCHLKASRYGVLKLFLKVMKGKVG